MLKNINKNIKILYVEDEDNIRENAVFYLKRLCLALYKNYE